MMVVVDFSYEWAIASETTKQVIFRNSQKTIVKAVQETSVLAFDEKQSFLV